MKLTIGWLYPDLMSIYGDRGNIITLSRRLEWKGIEVEIKRLGVENNAKEFAKVNLLFMGGTQDRQQTIVAADLQKKKDVLSEMIEKGVPGLYICGGFQFLGKYYKEADGTTIQQLGILDVYTQNPGGERLIGNIAIEVTGLPIKQRNDRLIMVGFENHGADEQSEGARLLDKRGADKNNRGPIMVGFENHGGRTLLGPNVKPLGKVIKGFGSNAEDGTEGAVYKNSIGTYLHGPILPKNPELADYLIQKALELKYPSSSGQIKEIMEPLDDNLSYAARQVVLTRLGIS